MRTHFKTYKEGRQCHYCELVCDEENQAGFCMCHMAALACQLGWTSMKFYVTSAAAHLARASVLDFTRATRSPSQVLKYTVASRGLGHATWS